MERPTDPTLFVLCGEEVVGTAEWICEDPEDAPDTSRPQDNETYAWQTTPRDSDEPFSDYFDTECEITPLAGAPDDYWKVLMRFMEPDGALPRCYYMDEPSFSAPVVVYGWEGDGVGDAGIGQDVELRTHFVERLPQMLEEDVGYANVDVDSAPQFQDCEFRYSLISASDLEGKAFGAEELEAGAGRIRPSGKNAVFRPALSGIYEFQVEIPNRPGVIPAGIEVIVQESERYVVNLENPSTGMTAADLLKSFSDGSEALLDGRPVADSSLITTGVTLKKEDGATETIIVMGDVLGTGRIDISQLVRLAKALSGEQPLEGPYLAAGDLNQSGSVDISDLTAEARLMNA